MRKSTSRNYLLTVLTTVLAFSYLDRVALGLLFQDIKVELQLSDTQLGMMGGLAFALFYAVMGLPIARWADRGNRVTIIASAAALWSAGVALCGLATSFLQLLIIRVGVAVGEAGCTPPSFSLIADYFNRHERARAAAIYGLGGPISLVIGYFLAGWLNELYGWRVTLIAIGLPGLALAGVVWLTLQEPRVAGHLTRAADSVGARRVALDAPQPMAEVFLTLWRNQTFRHLLLCLAIMSFFIYGLLQWQPAFIMRSFGLSSGEVGNWFAVTYGIPGILGSYLGGVWASRYAAGRERLQLRVLTITLCAGALFAACVYLVPTHQAAFVLMGCYVLSLGMVNGPVFAMIQSLVPERMRALAFAIVYLFMNLIGMGLGPLATGLLSDALQPAFAGESLRYALLAMTPGYFWVAWHAWRASLTVERDLGDAVE